MKLVSKLLVLMTVLATIYSCKEEAPKMINGFKYEIVSTHGGKVAQPGDYAYVALKIKDQNDSLLQEILEGPNMPLFKIPTEPSTSKQVNPIQDLAGIIGIGDEAIIYMPTDSLTNVPPNLKGMDYITYNMEVTKVQTEEEFNKEQEEKKAKAEADMKKVVEVINADLAVFKEGKSDMIKTTADGIKYIMHEEGNGARAEAGTTATVDYYGVLTNGEMFDNSYRVGQPYDVKVGAGAVIKGWDLGLPILKAGGNATIYIPYTLAYGEAGSPPVIPAKSDLVFNLAVRAVK